MNPMEIERKWLVGGWPEMDLPIVKDQFMRQGYLTVRPTVRIREEKDLTKEGETEFILCFKSKGTLARQEIEFPILEEHFHQLEDMIGLPLIPKRRRTYTLTDGLKLEVNHVDEGLPTEFWYAEIEFSSVREAADFHPQMYGLEMYLNDDVTEIPGQTMGAYWERTRLDNDSASA